MAALSGVAAAPVAPALASRPAAPPSEPAACDSLAAAPASENALVRLVNRHRAVAGLGRLTGDTTLRRAARGHSRHMARRGVFAHSDVLDWARGRPAGENLAQASSPSLAMTAMVLSPSHLRNLLDPGWRWIGIGAADNCAGAQLYTVNLMGPRP